MKNIKTGLPGKRWLIALFAGLYLYFLLPATATLFYELYHLTGVDAVYWGYSGFKIAGYYFGTWQHQLWACLLVAAIIVLVPTLVDRARKK